MHVYKWLMLLSVIAYLMVVDCGWWRRRRRRCKLVNCRWGSWGRWSSCPTSGCDVRGTQTRTRSERAKAACGGKKCDGSATSRQSCYGTAPRHCSYNAWSAWGPCNVTTCGEQGKERRDRSVRYVAGCGGNSCEGDCKDLRDCVGDSPVHCKFDTWSGWSTCSESTCGVEGTTKRTRTIRIRAECGGNNCTQPRRESDICYGADARDCVITNWSPWTQCVQKACNSSGSQSRLREILTVEGCGGQECTNKLNEERTCTKSDCVNPNCRRCVDSPCENVGDLFCHKTDVTKYVLCVQSDACLESRCETGKEFNSTTLECEQSSSVGNATTPQSILTEGPGASECCDCDIENPCATGTSDYYCHPDPAFYVHCSVGSCYNIQCATGTVWNNRLKICSP